MKKFLKKRWHSIPVGIVTVVLLFVLLAGSAFAIYTTWEGTAEVHIDECISVSNQGGDYGDFDASTHTWAVALKPGESKTLIVRVSNSSSANIPVTLTALEEYVSISASWSPANPTVNGGSYADSTLTVTATMDSTPGDYAVTLDISR